MSTSSLVACSLSRRCSSSSVGIDDRRSSEGTSFTAELLLLLQKIYPWPRAWKHVRRLNQIPGGEVEILLYPSSHLSPLGAEEKEKYFHSTSFRCTSIPVQSCVLRWQHERCIAEHWTNLAFRENPALEQTQRTKELNEKDREILQLLQVRERQRTEEEEGGGGRDCFRSWVVRVL